MYSDILSRIHLALYLTCMLTFYLAFNLEKGSGLARCRAGNLAEGFGSGALQQCEC
jgi:hypothetical protein